MLTNFMEQELRESIWPRARFNANSCSGNTSNITFPFYQLAAGKAGEFLQPDKSFSTELTERRSKQGAFPRIRGTVLPESD